MSSDAKGYLAAIFSAVCYGMNPLGAIFLYKDGINTNTALFSRFTIAAVLLAITMLIQRETFKITRRETMVLLCLGVLFGISSLSYYESFHYIDVGISSTLLFVYPIMVAIIMSLCFHEKLTTPMVCAIITATVGVFTLYYGSEFNLNIIGIILVLISALSYALYMIVVNQAKLSLSSIKLTFFATLFCAFVIFLHSLTSPVNHLMPLDTGRSIFYAFVLGLFPGLLSLLLMAIAVKHIGSTRTAIFGALEPATALFIGVVVFGEVFTFRLAVGALFIIGSVLLVIVAPQLMKGKRAKTNLRK